MWVGDRDMGGHEGRLACGAAIEGALRDLGYRSVEQDARHRATVQVEVMGSCVALGDGGQCVATVLLVVRGNSTALHAKSQSGNSVGWARSEVCRDLVQQVRARVGARRGGKTTADERPRAQAARTKLQLVLQWKGALQPMPLMKTTAFLQKMGYTFKLQSSGPEVCRFEIELDEPRERFASLLSTFLNVHYTAELGDGAGKTLTARLAPR
jgi:hypothetical protein